MLKQIIQRFIPRFLLKRYKKRQYQSILLNHDIETQPDLKVAQLLVDQESIFIDIGANIGLYTKYLAPLSGKTISFEPVPFTFEMLENTIRSFGLENVEAHQIAISDMMVSTEIEIPVQAGVQNYYRASLSGDTQSSTTIRFPVQTKTLDSFFEPPSNPISLVKCDVEGHELSVIKGAAGFLKHYDAPWLIEISDDPDEKESSACQLFSIMQDYDFSPFRFDGITLKKRHPGDKSVNYFFLKKGHIEKLSAKGLKIMS
jgi:FkbM family methyltransferase